MVRPATEEDMIIGEGCPPFSEDWYLFKKQATLTANTPTSIFDEDLAKNEAITVETFGTNGGTDVTMELKNKNDVIGQAVNGLNAPIQPRDEWYRLSVPMTFEEGDHMKLFATSAAGATNIKFFIKGHAVGQ